MPVFIGHLLEVLAEGLVSSRDSVETSSQVVFQRFEDLFDDLFTRLPGLVEVLLTDLTVFPLKYALKAEWSKSKWDTLFYWSSKLFLRGHD